MNKFRLMLFAFVAMVTTTLVACSDDDDNYNRFENLPIDVQKAFKNKYPESRVDSWKRKGVYYILEFKRNKFEAEAWFDNKAWLMTETDASYDKLPAVVTAAFKSSSYADWHIDDVDVVERNTMPNLYIIEVEKGKMDIELYYLEDGSLLKEVVDNDDDNDEYLPQIPSAITKAISDMYQGSVILDAELEKGIYEVDIMHQNVKKEVAFDKDCKWLHSKWDVLPTDLPKEVLSFIEKNYQGYKIDDAEIVYTAQNISYYEIELEKGDGEVVIKVSPKGEPIK